MSDIRIDLDGATAREPGKEISGTVHWTLPTPPQSIHTRLFWYTEGKGDRDLSVVDESSLNVSTAAGSTPFRFRLPAGPYSFSGNLISLIWAIEAVAEPGEETARMELTIGPGGREARIDTSEAKTTPSRSVV
jgi:hypothetical protein